MTARRLRTVFFGSSEFSVPLLERMLADQDVVAIVSQPDRPAGRGLALKSTPITEAARKAGRAAFTPEKLNAEFVAEMAALKPELLACASYGKLLPARLLSIEGMASLNVHPSLLPEYRGATPIQAALRDGLTRTGVTIFWMGPGLDDGDIALQEPLEIDPRDNYGSLHDKLALLGAAMLGDATRRLSQGALGHVPQRAEAATFTKPLSKEDARLRFDAPAQVVVNQVRSLSPKPGAWMMVAGQRVKVLEAVVAADVRGGKDAPGMVMGTDGGGPVVATSSGVIRLVSVIPEGKPKMTGAEFAKRALKHV